MKSEEAWRRAKGCLYDVLSGEEADEIIKALQQEPYEKFESAKDHIYKLAGDYKCWDNRLTQDEAVELCHILEQAPCTDAISRQAVLDLPKNTERGFGGKILEQSINIEYIKALPPVIPQYTDAEIQKMQDLEFAEIQKAYEIGKAENPNKWIPVSERLPEEGQEVLVNSIEFGNVVAWCENVEGDMCLLTHYGIATADMVKVDAKAWMPIPEYKPEEG